MYEAVVIQIRHQSRNNDRGGTGEASSHAYKAAYKGPSLADDDPRETLSKGIDPTVVGDQLRPCNQRLG